MQTDRKELEKKWVEKNVIRMDASKEERYWERKNHNKKQKEQKSDECVNKFINDKMNIIDEIRRKIAID